MSDEEETTEPLPTPPPKSPYEIVAPILKEVIDEEFEEEGFVAIFDNLHESLGLTRVDIGIAPMSDVVTSNNSIVQETNIEVKFYDLWKREITPETLVNPSRITGFAHRFRNAVREQNLGAAGQAAAWFFDIRRIDYPNDPTGNKSRFVAHIRVLGNNNALVETVG